MLDIHKNIPLPSVKGRGTSERVIEFHETLKVMEIGDSVVFSSNESTKGEHFRHVARQYGYKLSRRKSEDETTIRYWRIK
jgi:hypothetical protein